MKTSRSQFPKIFRVAGAACLLLFLLSAAVGCRHNTDCRKTDNAQILLINSLLDQANNYAYSAQSDSALIMIDSAETWLTRQGDCPAFQTMRGRCAEVRAMVQHMLRQDSEATLALYAQALDYYQRGNRPEFLPLAYANLGDVYIALNNLPSAVVKYRRAVVMADSLQLSSANRVSIRLGLGRIYTMLRDFEPAQRCYEEAWSRFHQLPSGMQAYFLTSYGNYFYYRKDYEQACRTFLQLDTLLRSQPTPDVPGLATCHLNLADVYLNLRDTAQAAAYLSQAVPFFEKWEDPTALYYIHTIQLGLALQRNQMALARQFVERDPNSPNVDFNMRNIRYRYIRSYYQRTGQWQRAYDMLTYECALNDSLLHDNETLRTSVIVSEMRNDTMRMHQQMVIAQKDHALERTRSIIAVLLLAAALMGITILFILQRYRHRDMQNQLSLMQLRLVNLRNRVSPHFIFNVLNDKILKSDAEQADQLTRLAALLREGLDLAGQDIISLHEELAFIRSYVEAERFEMRDDFLFRVYHAEDVDVTAVKVPSMLVQILVENAIRHGLRGIDRQQNLTIDICREGERSTRISVIDNGRGFDARNQIGNHKHTGLAVVQQTVVVHNAHHHRKMHFSIHNQTGADGKICGCTSTLIVPNDGITHPSAKREPKDAGQSN